ncbi:hypothetical protein ACFL12_01515 [Pseudomonadota bacterium]
MADVVGTSYASISGALSGARALGYARSASSLPGQNLPDEVSSSRFATHRATLTPGQASTMVSLAVFVGESIVNILKSLKDGAELSDSSKTNPSAGILVGYGTRLSVGNLQAGMDRTLDGIEQLVAKVAQGSANMVSSTSNDITIRTSQYGGQLHIAPLAMDLKGLNLENLDLHTPHGRTDAIARLGTAILASQEKVLKLKALQNGLGDNDALGNALRALNAGSNGMRGALVDLSA